ncbi:MAG TPA: class III extradiol ring-cleavage dioxygenase [Thermoanaerobaculia bacterium]
MKCPAVFVAHGAPSLALQDDAVTRALRTFGETLDGARAIAVVSAHWETRAGVRVNAVAKPEVIYDFGGFAPELYTMRYDAPGDPELAREIATMIGASLETERGWDHGLWVPLTHIRPRADIPVVEISLPAPSRGDDLLRLGAALAPLRDRGIVVMGTGGIVHNLRRINFAGVNAPAEEWAREFDTWVAERIEARDYAALARYQEAPNARDAVPTPEHYEPILVAAGAAGDDTPRTIVDAFHYGTLSMRSIAFG